VCTTCTPSQSQGTAQNQHHLNLLTRVCNPDEARAATSHIGERDGNVNAEGDADGGGEREVSTSDED